jgi:hypothetical protein
VEPEQGRSDDCASPADQLTLPQPLNDAGQPWAEMEELLKTNDLVLISYVEALMRDAGIEVLVLDQNMSVIEGSLGVLPRRMLVPGDRLNAARAILRDAGIGAELEKPR